MKVVIDTNVLVSSVLSENSPPSKVFKQLRLRLFELVVSEEILSEYRRALGYKRTYKYHKYTPEQIDGLLDDLRQFATIITSTENIDIVSSDPDDNKLIECAVAGEADYIVSGDAHLLRLAEYNRIPILSPAAFLMVLEQK